jgi:tetratricopeptide (TPR) repeat protein
MPSKSRCSSSIDPHPTASRARGTAACYALAGKIGRARETIDRLAAGDRPAAAGIVFAVGHPVADAGDDESAGPIMRLVVEYQPDNYMALYHAGISEYILGHADLARANLEKFLSIYQAEDGWRANARTVLGRLDGR